MLGEIGADTGRDRATDRGSGTCRLSLALASQFTEVTAVDVSDAMLDALSTRAAQRGG